MQFSIIVPVYNAEKYLKKCIESVLSNNGDYELILVDDGSMDESLKICQEYTEKFSKVKLYTKENGGVSSARNYGLDVAIGENIIFIDADDYVESNMIEKLSIILNKKEYDFISYGYDIDIDGKITNSNYIGKEFSGVLNISDIEKNFYQYSIQNEINPVWNKVFKKSVIDSKNLRFNNLKFGEDLCFVLDYIEGLTGNCIFLGEIFYHYFQNQSSVTCSYSENRYNDEIISINRLKKYIVNSGIWSEEEFELINHKYRMLCLYEIYNLSSAKCTLNYGNIKSILFNLVKNDSIKEALRVTKRDCKLSKVECILIYLLNKNIILPIYFYIILKRKKVH